MTQIFGVMLRFDSIRFVGQGHGSKFNFTGGKCCFFLRKKLGKYQIMQHGGKSDLNRKL